ncbi:MAG: BMP family ABC transporter substrate-binding protein [Chloroflexi bacterium]|nr:BMP family ABC transporter substrate-binding protein [Chloroflexota bacterium]
MWRASKSFMLYRVLVAVLLAAVLLAACGGDDDDEKQDNKEQTTLNPDFKLGLVTNVGGTISDGGFSESAHLGATRAAADLKLDYAYGLSRDDQDYAIQLDRLIGEGRNIIVTVGFPMEAITYEYATKHPEVYFIGVDHSYSDQEEIPANLIGLQFAEDEAAFVVGALAGLMTESDTVAVIGGIEIPPVVKLAEGFQNGAKYVNPDVNVIIVYTGTFGDPEKGTETAQDFITQGADVIFGAAGPTGYAGIQYAARQGVWVIGVDQDEWRTNFREGSLEGSDFVLTSALKRVDNGVYQAIQNVVSKQAVGGLLTLKTVDCGVGYAPFHQTEEKVPANTKQMMEAIWRALAAGTLQTGAQFTSTTAPESLAEGAMPDVPADAPQLSDCEN